MAQDRAAFIENSDADIVVLDIPLLFETGGESKMDATACVFVDDETQKERVMARGTMTIDQFEAIKAKQMPAAEKCARADYIISTDTIEHAQTQVQQIVQHLRERLRHA